MLLRLLQTIPTKQTVKKEDMRHINLHILQTVKINKHFNKFWLECRKSKIKIGKTTLNTNKTPIIFLMLAKLKVTSDVITNLPRAKNK